MKIERIKNAKRNVVFGSISKVYQILIPFLMRTAITYFLGVKYLGLNSLFTSILQVLNLAELGVGSAMVYSMYKPIVEDDTSTICALMKLYRIYYRIIGIVIAVAGLILLPFIPKLINNGENEIPADVNIYILYILNLSSTVLSYWLFAYKNSLLQAHQRTDIVSKVMLVTHTIQYLFQFIVLAVFKNYYFYVIVILLTQALTNVTTAVITTKLYPDYKPIGEIDKSVVKQINGRIKDLFTSKIGAVIVNSADTIVVSAFLGLTMLAIYQNYFYIITAIIGFVAILFQSCTAGIGNSLIVETKEKNFKDFKKFTFLIAWIAGACSSCFLCVFQPFMKVWMGEDLLLPFSAVICLCIYFFIYEINQLLNTYKDAAGIWHQDRWRPLVTAMTNLGLNLIMVQFWGIYGVLLSTVISMVLVGMPWLFHNLFTTLFEKKYMKKYVLGILQYFVVSCISCFISYMLCSFIKVDMNDYIRVVINILISFILPNIIFLIVYHKSEEFKECVYLADKITKGKLKLTRFILNSNKED